MGESPYAEMRGDTNDLELSAVDKAAIANARSAGVPVAVVLIAGIIGSMGTAVAGGGTLPGMTLVGWWGYVPASSH